jgi:F-type H+-transporting ATPase subunit delta
MSSRDRVSDYAEAFYSASWERWLAALQSAAQQLAEHPELRTRLDGSRSDFSQIQPLVDKILPGDVDRPVRNLLYTVVQRGDLALLEGIIEALRARVRQREAGPTEVEIVSAVPLTDDERQMLVAKLEEQHGALTIRYRVDPQILGGLIVRIGDELIDNSVASRLAAMRQALGIRTAG